MIKLPLKTVMVEISLKQGKALRFNKEMSCLLIKKDELNKKNNEIKNKFKEISKLINNKTFTFLKKVRNWFIIWIDQT